MQSFRHVYILGKQKHDIYDSNIRQREVNPLSVVYPYKSVSYNLYKILKTTGPILMRFFLLDRAIHEVNLCYYTTRAQPRAET